MDLRRIRVGSAWICVGSAWIRVGSAWIRVGSARIRVGSAWIRVGSAWIRVGSAWIRVHVRVGSPWIRVGSAWICVRSAQIFFGSALMIRPDLRRIWLDLRRVQVGVASAVGSVAERCWGRQPLELKRGSGGGSPWNRKFIIHCQQPFECSSPFITKIVPSSDDFLLTDKGGVKFTGKFPNPFVYSTVSCAGDPLEGHLNVCKSSWSALGPQAGSILAMKVSLWPCAAGC